LAEKLASKIKMGKMQNMTASGDISTQLWMLLLKISWLTGKNVASNVPMTKPIKSSTTA